MASRQTSPFGTLLLRQRRAAGLSQEALAERAGLSVNTIGALEAGVSQAPRRETLDLLVAALATALALSPQDQDALADEFAAAARAARAVPFDAAISEPAAAGAVPGPPDALPASPPVVRSNLPVQVTSFIGREREQAEVAALLTDAHLVTLSGSGGVGKTRLALQVVAALTDRFPDGLWLVELAALSDPTLVPQTVATVLGLREEPGQSLLATLTSHVVPRQLLLLLDNCEHLIGACAELATALLRSCPDLRLLATSREGLEVAGETLYRVPSLALPDPQLLPAVGRLPDYEAVRLFLDRARACRPHFGLTEANAAAVVTACRRLDGIPLAIELAAARVDVLSVEQIAARLDDRFRLLTGGPRTAVPRQQTLRATLEWSWDLLTAGEQVVLRRLAVFMGGWTLDAAEAVCAAADLPSDEVLDLLAGLVSKSLVQVSTTDGQTRYGLLETVRQYGQEQLAVSGEGAAVRDRHLAWCLALAEEAEPALEGPEQGAWLSRLETEHDNMRAALRWSLQDGDDTALGLRLSGALWRFWESRGYISEGRGWLEAALASGGPATTTAYAMALNAAGNLAERQGDYERAVALHEDALVLRRERGDRQGIAASLNNLGIVAYHQGNYGRAATLHEESLALERELGDRWGVASSLNNLGIVAYLQGDYGRTVALHEEALALFRELGDNLRIATALTNLGAVVCQQGDYGRAAALHEEALALNRRLGSKWGIAASLVNLGGVAYQQGDYERTRALYIEGILLSRDIGARELVAAVLEGMAWLLVAHGQAHRAAALAGAAEEVREVLGVPLEPEQWAEHDQALQAMRAALGEEAFAAAWAAGRTLSLEEAIALALEHGEATEPGEAT
jgi:non-specific serine/threonine protein kinase